MNVTFTSAITHQKHPAKSGRSTRSAVDIFNTLCVFTKELIGEQEIKLECMNYGITSKDQGLKTRFYYPGCGMPCLDLGIKYQTGNGHKL